MNNIFIKDGQFKKTTILFLIITPLVLGILAIAVGRFIVPPTEVVKTLLKDITGYKPDKMTISVIFNMRLPRIVTAIVVGASLTCAGACFQALFSNPLATPDLLGASAGTCVGAIIAIIMGLGIVPIQIFGLVFGLFAVFVCLQLNRNSRSIINLVLTGVIVGSLFNAFSGLLKFTADPMDKLPEITYWLMGSFAGSSFKNLLLSMPFILTGIVIIFLFRWRLNLMSLSDDEARSCGLNLERNRAMFVIASTMITASSIAMCGQVGWIGLLVPHIARLCVGSNNLHVIPFSISLGASMMIIIDTISRSVSTSEIPISILTAIIGAPIFISLLKRNNKR